MGRENELVKEWCLRRLPVSRNCRAGEMPSELSPLPTIVNFLSCSWSWEHCSASLSLLHTINGFLSN